MKYKVILRYDSGTNKNQVGFSFYTRSQAVNCVNSWTEVAGQTAAYFDGIGWTSF